MPASLKAVRALPKADLHSHIDGSVPSKELFRIAKDHRRQILTRNHKELGTVSAFMEHIEGDGYHSMLENVVDRFYPITNLMQTEGTIKDVGVAYVRGQKEDGVAYAEGRFAPQYHTREGLSLDQVIAAMAEGLTEGSEKYGVKVGMIVAIGRESTPELGEEVSKSASRSRTAVALDLGGPEPGNPPQKFKRAFNSAASSGLKVTVHAGEGAGSIRQNLANIRSAITQLKANRLGHAVDLARDPRLVSLVKARSIGIEMNPISNLVLGKIGDLRDLSIDRLVKNGVMVSINSDDPSLWSEGSLSSVYNRVLDAYGFGPEELDLLVNNSITGAFAPESVKSWLREEYRAARRRLL